MSKVGYSDSDDAMTEGVLHADLARANLLRMRGDYKAAVDQCLSILKKAPESGDAHTLIADIYAEQGDLEQASQWYELALDLNPNSKQDQAKLDQIMQRRKEREAASTAEQLGLPPERPNLALVGGVMAVIAVALGIGAYMLGQRTTEGQRISGTRNVTVTAPLQPEDDATPAGESPASPASPPATGTVASTTPQDDRTLTQLIAQRSPEGSHVSGVQQDPRTKVLTITYSLRADEDERRIGAEIARGALGQVSDALLVVLRGVKNDRVVYAADVPRARLSETETESWKQANPTSDAWIGHVLTNEWPARPAMPAAPAPTTPAPATTSTGGNNFAPLQSNSTGTTGP